jgi:hypothetical protein
MLKNPQALKTLNPLDLSLPTQEHIRRRPNGKEKGKYLIYICIQIFLSVDVLFKFHIYVWLRALYFDW